jgi:hypothetical protein
MKERIIIAVGKDWDGFTFRLRPRSKQLLKGLGPQTKGMQSPKSEVRSPKSGGSPKSGVRSPKSGEKASDIGRRTSDIPPEPLMSQVSISFDEKKGFEALHAPIYKYVVEMLTGMPYEEIAKLGGAEFVDEDEKVIYEF